MPRIALSGLVATAAAAALLLSLPRTAAAYQCKSSFIQAEAIHKLRIKSQASAKAFWSAKTKQAYGLPWSLWKIAAAPSVSCNHTGAKWYCIAKAKPCLYAVP